MNNYKEMSVKELKVAAKELGIKLGSARTKDAIIEKITAVVEVPEVETVAEEVVNTNEVVATAVEFGWKPKLYLALEEKCRSFLEKKTESNESSAEYRMEFTSVDDLKRYLKSLKGEKLYAYGKMLEVEWKENANDSITRMRACMAIKAKFFDKATIKESKGEVKSPWVNFTLAKLEAIAEELGITYTKSANLEITRMWCTRALVVNGVNAESYK